MGHQQLTYLKENFMRTQIITLTTLLSFVAGAAMAQTPAQAVQDVQQYNQDVRQLNTDIRNNRADVKKDSWDAAHDQRDIDRDDALRNADKAREEHDLKDGDLKGAAYWNKQRKDENAEIRHDRKDLAHSDRDVRNAKARLAKDEKVRHHDVAKRNRAAKKI
jgi:outer membrane murein-binding lipoprotein Lpp